MPPINGYMAQLLQKTNNTNNKVFFAQRLGEVTIKCNLRNYVHLQKKNWPRQSVTIQLVVRKLSSTCVALTRLILMFPFNHRLQRKMRLFPSPNLPKKEEIFEDRYKKKIAIIKKHKANDAIIQFKQIVLISLNQDELYPVQKNTANPHPR